MQFDSLRRENLDSHLPSQLAGALDHRPEVPYESMAHPIKILTREDSFAELLDVQKEHQLRSDVAVGLLDRLSVGDVVPNTLEFDKGVAFAFIGSRTFKPGTGALEAFVNGEGAKLVKNHRLADLLLQLDGASFQAIVFPGAKTLVRCEFELINQVASS